MRVRLQEIRATLVATDPYPWSAIESWIAKARPLFRTGLHEHLRDFEKETAAPAWVTSPRTSRNFEEIEALDGEVNAKIAADAKTRILSFLDGVLSVLGEDGNAGASQEECSPRASLPPGTLRESVKGGAPPVPAKGRRLAESTGVGLGAVQILRESIRAVPATKYALGVAGIAAAGSIALRLLGSPTAAVIGITVTLAGSVVLLVFARLTRQKPDTFLGPMKISVWCVTLLFVCTLLMLFTSFFFGVPLPLQPGPPSVLAVAHSAKESTFSLLVRVHGPAGPSDVIGHGKATLDLGTDRRGPLSVSDRGEVSFNEIPTQFADKKIPLWVEVPGFAMKDSGLQTIPPTHVIYLAMVPLPPKPKRIAGLVRDEQMNGVGGVRVLLPSLSVETTTDNDGHFELSVAAPGEREVLLRAERKGYLPGEQYVTAGNTDLGLVLERTHR